MAETEICEKVQYPRFPSATWKTLNLETFHYRPLKKPGICWKIWKSGEKNLWNLICPTFQNMLETRCLIAHWCELNKAMVTWDLGNSHFDLKKVGKVHIILWDTGSENHGYNQKSDDECKVEGTSYTWNMSRLYITSSTLVFHTCFYQLQVHVNLSFWSSLTWYMYTWNRN